MMNIIKCVAWSECDPLWKNWREFKKDDPEPQAINASSVYVDIECLKGKVPRRTLAFIREDPSDPTTSRNILGCAIVYAKDVPDLKIGGLGNVAVDPLYRKNGIASKLTEVALCYMHNAGFDVSVLYASVLRVYEKHGYVAIKDNTMYRPIRGIPLEFDMNRLVNIHKEVGGCW